MRSPFIGALLFTAAVFAAVPRVTLPITATVSSPDPDTAAFLYTRGNRAPLLVGNDGSAGTGGFRAWTSTPALVETADQRTGRSKIVQTVHGVAGKDWIATLSQEDSKLRLFEIEKDGDLDDAAELRVWGDFSALCFWRADSGRVYGYLFGKKSMEMLLLDESDDDLEIVSVQTFKVPIEAGACTVLQSRNKVLFGGEDGTLHAFTAAESTADPAVSVVSNFDGEIAGLATYSSRATESVFVVFEDEIRVLNSTFDRIGTINLSGAEELQTKGISLIQAPLPKHPAGALGLAIESDTVTGYALASLDPVFSALNIKANTAFDPSANTCKGSRCKPLRCSNLKNCSNSGFCPSQRRSGTCDCFAGSAGSTCAELRCLANCSNHGKCKKHNICKCDKGWAGPTCAWKVVRAKYETDATGADGDDPAIWVNPLDPAKSRIITTTKSEEGAGLNVFDLKGKMTDHVDAGEPNNVDVIYGFDFDGRETDLAYAACRDDETLCLFEITSDGKLLTVAGGKQPTPPKFKVYGSCVYRSSLTDTTYLFVNAKTGEYLQYSLTSANGTLQTALVRRFIGGTGGQVEGCVADDANRRLFVGEEPYGLWAFDAEPTGSPNGTLVDSVDGGMWADVEGVTLVTGENDDDGWIIVSQQGVSAYNIYERREPHRFVRTFTVATSNDGKVDGVTNTDGLTAVGVPLGEFKKGLLVVHDDVNRLPNGKPSELASFKLVDLGDVLEGL